MYRVLLVAVLTVKVGGLQMSDAPTESAMAMSMLGAGVVSTLDPMLTNAKGETFHVTQAGDHLMVGIPSFGQTFNESDPAGQELIVTGTFNQFGDHSDTCDDLQISKLTFQGKRLPKGISKIVFSAVPHYNINSTNFEYNDTSYAGFTVTTDTAQNMSATDFLSGVPECVITYKKPAVSLPTRRSFAHRVTQFHGTCSFTKAHEINLFWGIVYKGWTHTYGVPNSDVISYANDISFTMSGAGTEEDGHPGLLGTSNHTVESAAVPGCYKPQPVGTGFR